MATNPMIAALQNSRQSAPVSSSGPTAGPAAPAPEAPVDPMEAVNAKLDQILALLSKDEAAEGTVAPENPNNGNPADA